jgi:DNA-binding CsgD family transcriptional regulator
MYKAARTLPLVAVLMTLGLVIAGIWTNVVGYSVNLLPSDLGLLEGTYNRDAFHTGRLLVGILFFVFARYLPRIQAPLTVITALLMSVATGILIISYHQTLVDPLTLAFCGVAVSSAAYSFITWIFYLHAAKGMPTRLIVWCVAISLVFETVCSILVSLYLEPALQMFLVMCAPLLVAACYFAVTRLDTGHKAPVEPQHKVTGFEKYALLTQVVIFTAALIFVRALSNIGIWGETRANFTGMTELSIGELAIICATILLLTFLVFDLLRNRLSLPLRCIIGFAAILGGLQILALSNDLQFGNSFDSVTSAVEIFSHLVRWMIIIECVRSIDMPPYRVVGISNATSAALSLFWAHLLAPLAFATNTFVMVIVYVLLVVVILLFVMTSGSRKTSVWSTASDDEQARFAAFAHRWDLSPRETEIFSLLMLGKKRAEIEGDLHLSEGTIKTHISNIYKKLDVHSKYEMRQLYERGTDGGGMAGPTSTGAGDAGS